MAMPADQRPDVETLAAAIARARAEAAVPRGAARPAFAGGAHPDVARRRVDRRLRCASDARLALRDALRDGVVAVAARRWITLRAHAIYLAAGAVLGFAALQDASGRILGRPGLGVVALVLPLVPLSISILLEATLSRGSFAHALHRKLSHLPGKAGRWFARREQAFAAVDEDFQRFGHGGDAVWPATLAYLAAWTLESFETWAILKLLGAQVPFWMVLSFEPPLSLLRSAAFFAPAGLGAQDLGYVAFLGGGPMAFAFVAVKRLKELVWAGVGWALLLLGKSAAPVSVQLADGDAAPT